MPVTAKLSKKLYDTLGDEVTNELVDWFNLVDTQYKSELKDLAEGYFARFEAKLHAELAAVRADLLKWMFVYWTGSVLAIAAFVLMGIRLSR